MSFEGPSRPWGDVDYGVWDRVKVLAPGGPPPILGRVTRLEFGWDRECKSVTLETDEGLILTCDPQYVHRENFTISEEPS